MALLLEKRLRNRDGSNDLLLLVVGIGAIVVCAHKARDVHRPTGYIAEVVADEGRDASGARRVWRVQLRVPGVLGEPDVVPERRKGDIVELHTGVDAVVGGTVWRQGAHIIRVDLVKGEASSGSLGSSRSRTTQAAVIESHTHSPLGRDGQIGLELIDFRLVIVDLDGSCPTLAAIVGSRQQDVCHARAVVLPGHVERILAPDELVADAKTVEDAIAEGRVGVAKRWRGDVVSDR